MIARDAAEALAARHGLHRGGTRSTIWTGARAILARLEGCPRDG